MLKRKEGRMLDCKNNRLDYGKLLRPPDGYQLDQAVATTYSADLQTLLSIPVALVYAQTLEGDISEARVQLLEAIREFSQRVLIYHQKGQLHVPKANSLHALIEDTLVPVLPKDAYTAFHPKVWLIRYVAKDGDEPPLFRLIVLSRNPTFDRSWDVACSLDGVITTRLQKENVPLLEFFKFLDRLQPIPHSGKLFEELARVEFTPPDGFGKLVFHPIGIAGYEQNPVQVQKCDRALVISRFLHSKALQSIRKNTDKELHVLSEKVDLLPIPISLREQFRSYYLSDLIIEGEYNDLAEDGDPDLQKQHLHAKLFIFRTIGKASRWFLGSANATEAAFRRNVEFMVELSSDAYEARTRRVLSNLVDADGTGAFIELPSDEEKQDPKAEARRKAVREFEYALLKAEIEAHLETGTQQGTYDLLFRIVSPAFPKIADFTVTVKPFNIDVTPQALTSVASKSLRFSAISESYLSRFIHFSITGRDFPSRQFLVCVPITGLPSQRLDRIFRKMIDSQDKFFQYLRFLLAEEITKEELLRVPTNEGGTGTDGDSMGFDFPLYEQLLIAASRAPSKLRAVDDVIKKLTAEDSNVVPTDFLEFWESFLPLLPKPEKANG